MSSARLDASIDSSRRVMPGVRLLRVEFETERETCRSRTARGFSQVGVESSLLMFRRRASSGAGHHKAGVE
jgi:hypothetical protein